MNFNIVKAFRQLEAAEVDPCLLAYSVILSKDPDNYQSYTPQHKICKSLNKESGSLIKYFKTGMQEDGYKGYSTNYQDLNIDVYKVELWKLVQEVLRLLDCDIQKLEDQIFPTTIQVDDILVTDIVHSSRVDNKNYINHSRSNNIQRNESLTKYQSSPKIFVCIRMLDI